MSRAQYLIGPTARRDLTRFVDHFSTVAGRSTSARFTRCVRATLEAIATGPMLSSPVASRVARLTGLRKRHVADFDGVIVFYLPRPHLVTILRIMHAAQDRWSVFEADQTAAR